MPAIKTPHSHFSKCDAGSVRNEEPLALEEKYPNTKEAKKKLPPGSPQIKVRFCAAMNPLNVFAVTYNINISASSKPVNPNICTGLSNNVFLKNSPNLFALNVLFILIY